MSTDLAHRPQEVLDPSSGEILELATLEDEQLAVALERVREAKRALDEFLSSVSREVLARMDHVREWTFHIGDYKVTGKSEEAGKDYDPKALDAALRPLVEQGVIAESALLAAVAPSERLEVKKRGVNALLKGGGRIKEAVESAESQRPRGNVRVERVRT